MNFDKVYYSKIFAYLLILAGVWNLVDGIGSIIVFSSQPFLDQAPRIIRLLIGIALLADYWLVHRKLRGKS